MHDIRRTDDPVKGLQVRENLLARCQICHPDATANFPDAWLSHYVPSAERHPLVFAVDTFYKIFIPGVLGGMGLIVALDASWRVRKQLSDRRRPSRTPAQPVGPTESAGAAANLGPEPVSQGASSGVEQGAGAAPPAAEPSLPPPPAGNEPAGGDPGNGEGGDA